MGGACAGCVAREDLFAGGGELLLLVGGACEGGAALEGLFAGEKEPCLTMAGDVFKIMSTAFPN